MCFLHLDMFRYMCDYGTNEQVERMWQFLRVHNQDCGGCWANLRVRAYVTEDRFKSTIYSNLHMSSLMSSMRRSGGVFECDKRLGGQHFVFAYPPSFDDSPVAQLEGFVSFDPREESWVIADVTSRTLFDDPDPILRWLDEERVFAANSSPSAPSLQQEVWMEIAEGREAIAKVRWQGEVKTIADSWSLHGRYRGLIARHLDADLLQESCSDPGLRRVNTDAATRLALHDLVGKYDGRVPFSSFAKTELQHRKIDRYRHARLDALSRSESIESPGIESEHETAFEEFAAESATCPHAGNGLQGMSDAETKIDLEWRLKRLRPYLTGRESAILRALSTEHLTDAELAARLGVARETVTRDRASIRSKAAAIDWARTA